MKISKKILIIPIILSCSVLNFIFADDSDCWKFGWMRYKQDWNNWFEIVNNSRETESNPRTNFLTIEEQTSIITKNDLNTAMLNLKKYCCTHELWWLKQDFETCKDDSIFFNDNALDSPYLFDHLVDIMMRRLSWVAGDDNIYTKTNMSLDELWTSWRERIDEKATSTEWASPEIIINQYKKVWQQSPSNYGFDITKRIYNIFNQNPNNFLQYVSWEWNTEDSKKVANALKSYKHRKLYDRYMNVCALSEYFYALLNVWSDSNDKGKIFGGITACENMVKNKIKQENEYTTLVVQKASNQFLSNYVGWYLSYLHWRQLTLQKLFKEITDRRFDVINAVPCLQRACVK